MQDTLWAHPICYTVAVDGSGASLAAFEEVVRLSTPNDVCNIIHVADDSKTYLPSEQQPHAIRSYYESKCLPYFMKGSSSVNIRYKARSEPSKNEIINFARQKNTDILVLGCVGRKGKKEDPMILGSTADASLRQAGMTSLIVKSGRGMSQGAPGTALSLRNQKNLSTVFTVAIDGSQRSHEGLLLALSLASPKKDSICLVHVDNYFNRFGQDKYKPDKIAERYGKIAIELSAGIEGRKQETPFVQFFLSEKTEKDAVVADAIVREAEETHGSQYLIIGVDGLGAYLQGRPPSLSSLSDRIIKLTKCNVIAIQPRRKSLSA